MSRDVDPRLLELLNTASSLQLFELSTVIERLLADPRRIIAVRVNLHLGQTVRFLDWRDGGLREGKVLAMKDTQVVLQDLRERREWKRQPRLACDLALRQLVPRVQPSNLANHVHGDHSSNPAAQKNSRVG
nr:hypothetical protein [Pseudomonas aeruginosa]